jgi:hypothetical protein
VDLMADLMAHHRVVVLVLVAEESLVDFLLNNARPRLQSVEDFARRD